MVRRIIPVRRLRRLPAELSRTAMIGVSVLLSLAMVIGAATG